MSDFDPVLTRREFMETVVVPAPRADVWDAWTTVRGAESFFAPRARIEAVPGGAYELLFDLTQPEGLQGSEGCVIQKLEPPELLTFSWNFPPSLGTLRAQGAQTEVGVSLQVLGPAETRVVLMHGGWKTGPEWDAGLAYFQQAWKRVLRRLRYRFEHGPLDWDNLPDL